MRRLATATIVTLAVLTGFALAPTARAALPGKIAFYSNRDGNFDIYTMNADGSGQTRATNNSAYDAGPAWSPDGTKIAFHSNRDDPNPTTCFSTPPYTCIWEIYTMNANGTNEVKLTRNSANNFVPAWSPDGTRIAFMSNSNGNFEIHTMNADGTEQINITNNAAFDADPAFSPNGQRIAFRSTRDSYCPPNAPVCNISGKIYTMAADGSDVIRLTFETRNDSEPAFSPDGTKIVFSRNIFRHNKVHTMAADGSGQTNLSTNQAYRLRDDLHPSFSPDGQRIAFSSDRDGSSQGNFQIYTMAADGSDVVRLTNNAGADLGPDWQHAPMRSAFKNAAHFCKAERAFWGDQFASRDGGGANAYGECVSGK